MIISDLWVSRSEGFYKMFGVRSEGLYVWSEIRGNCVYYTMAMYIHRVNYKFSHHVIGINQNLAKNGIAIYTGVMLATPHHSNIQRLCDYKSQFGLCVCASKYYQQRGVLCDYHKEKLIDYYGCYLS